MQVVFTQLFATLLTWLLSSTAWLFILIFKTFMTSLTAFMIIILIIVRTYLEDKYLKENLEGYAKFSEKSRYRLFPFIW